MRTDTDRNKGRFSALLGPLATLPGIGAALLPALTCPACWPAYAGLLSALGLGFVDYTPWLLPLTAGLLAVGLLALAWQGRRRDDYRPLWLGLPGAALVLAGKFWLASDLLLYGGIALLVMASVWNLLPARACPDDRCGCAPGTGSRPG